MSEPTTAFEDSGHTDWTTYAEEQAFLGAVEAGSSRMSYEQIATSYEGRRVDLVTVAEGDPPGTPILLVACQHGHEPAGREAALTLLRDLAYTDDPDLISYLSDHPVMIVPTANPDGRYHNTRDGSPGGNRNRDWLALVTPEVQAMTEVVRDYDPSIVVDLHEMQTQPENMQDVEMQTPTQRGTDYQVYDAVLAFVRDEVFAMLDAENVEHDWFLSRGDVRMCHYVLGLRATHAILLETLRIVNPRIDRWVWHRMVLDVILEWHLANATEIDTRMEAARQRAHHRAARLGPWWLTGQYANPRHPATSGTSVETFGYEVDASVLSVLDSHGVTYQEDGESYFVPMMQGLSPLVAMLLDPDSEHRVADGIRKTGWPSMPDFSGDLDVWNVVSL